MLIGEMKSSNHKRDYVRTEREWDVLSGELGIPRVAYSPTSLDDSVWINGEIILREEVRFVRMSSLLIVEWQISKTLVLC